MESGSRATDAEQFFALLQLKILNFSIKFLKLETEVKQCVFDNKILSVHICSYRGGDTNTKVGGLTFTDKCSGNTTILTIQYTGLYSSIQWYGISWCQRRKTY